MDNSQNWLCDILPTAVSPTGHFADSIMNNSGQRLFVGEMANTPLIPFYVVKRYKGKEIKEFNLRNLMKFVINRFGKVWKTCNVLEVNYKFQEDGSDLGSKYFDYDEKQLENYLKKTVKYWKGYRNPEGVPIEDAWKCQKCDFAENCEWRLNKIKEHAQRRRDL
ncbi:exonuclease V [Rhizophagus clarus]|uniref:Exonuclease V n=1 Tax=Rhizophagus clarus TaxID=94130 RepID=A0A8H3LU85_9GLOM|nr:exonuclease V [Rhizophagus clarus]